MKIKYTESFVLEDNDQCDMSLGLKSIIVSPQSIKKVSPKAITKLSPQSIKKVSPKSIKKIITKIITDDKNYKEGSLIH